jgi:predicted amidohydrolase YtcJ
MRLSIRSSTAAGRVRLAGLLLALTAASAVAAPGAADLVVTDARIYTAAGPALAEALAVRHGVLVYVGDAKGALAFIGPRTTVKHADGRLVVPGLVDSHIHPLDILDLDVCDLDNAAKTLRQIATIVRGCIAHYRLPPGRWLNVHQWNPSGGNQPDVELPTLRAALDAAAPNNPVELMGNDGHKGAYNGAALALARNPAGTQIGLSRATLAGEFADYRKLVGVDERGEPNGEVNEDARDTMPSGDRLYNDLAKVLEAPLRIPARLNSVGITAVLDAAAYPEGLAVYDKLLKSGRMTVRASLAQFYDPSRTRTADGRVDYDAMVETAKATRAKYAGNPFVRADFIKLFADGVVEGNPFGTPPTLGNAALLEPYLQPTFATDAAGHATVTGYVDTASPTCAAVRTEPAKYEAAADVAAFMKSNGFHPGQCQISSGMLQHPREIQLEYVRRMHLAGFNMHIHVIGDRALRTALDAIEAARAADGVTTTRDSVAHVQLTRPEDVARIGRDRLYVAYTYSWANDELEYDMTIVPFLHRMIGNSDASRHAAGSWYEENTYPFRTSKDAGAILVAGSDAPVSTRDPQPFVNMATAVTRRIPGQPAFNSRQTLTIREVLDAYTINGARFLGRDAEFGSLQPGKSADFVVLDRDILALADSGQGDEVAKTRVLETWFRGKRVYASAGR